MKGMILNLQKNYTDAILIWDQVKKRIIDWHLLKTQNKNRFLARKRNFVVRIRNV